MKFFSEKKLVRGFKILSKFGMFKIYGSGGIEIALCTNLIIRSQTSDKAKPRVIMGRKGIGGYMNLWYVIQTKPKKEEDAKSYLSTRGLEIFSPLIETFLIRNGRMNKELKPLFPGYMFGRFDLERDYPLVRWGRGVKKVLGLVGNYPTPVSEEVVEIIKKRTDSYGVVRKSYHLEANDRVRIKSGPLKDLLGIFERWVSDSDRVRVLLTLIGYQPSIELHYSMIEKVA